MTKHRMRAAALLAAGAVAGGATAVSLSANAVEGEDSTTGAAVAQAGPGGGHGGPGGHGRGFGADTAELAESLGVTEEKLEAALDAVREDLAPDEKPADGEERTFPTEEDRAAQTAAFAKALADELGIAESKVTAALEKIRSADAAERRTELGKRLDQAIEDGELTAADKASVLKAYDAGVLGGPR